MNCLGKSRNRHSYALRMMRVCIVAATATHLFSTEMRKTFHYALANENFGYALKWFVCLFVFFFVCACLVS